MVSMSRGSDDMPRIRPDSIRSDIPRIEMSPKATKNIFDWCGLIENAEEIHSIDSSLKWLAEFLPTKGRLFYHTLWRPRQSPPNPHGSRKEWVLV